MSTPTSIYRKAAATDALRQGEIVSNIIQAKLKIETIGSEDLVVGETEHEYAVVMSQDCDLTWAWEALKNGENLDKYLSSVLFCEAKPADEFAHERGYNKRARRKLGENRDERYQFLQKVECDFDLLEEGVPELMVDFKRYFSLPTAEVYFRLESDELERSEKLQGRCLLNHPYLQDLINRFWYFQCRVALPEQHFSERYIPPV